MKFLNKLERKYGKYAIKNLSLYVIGMYIIGFAIYLMVHTAVNSLSLNPYMILHGEVWRLVTFLLDPPTTSLIFIVFALLFYYNICSSLEAVWGAFRFNLYELFCVSKTEGLFLDFSAFFYNPSVIFQRK